MPSESTEVPAMWSMRPSSYAPKWSSSGTTEETYGQKGRGNVPGKKAARVEVRDNGDINAKLEGKNAWDEVVRNLVPKILDLSVVEWSKQKLAAVQKLRDALDNEFEYVGNPLSTIAFRTLITRFLKSERSRLKTKWLEKKDYCPFRVNGTQWLRLKDYWQTDA